VKIIKTIMPLEGTSSDRVKGDQVSKNSEEARDGLHFENNMPEERPVKKKWTFMHYGAGDNNLDRFIYNDVDEMETVGSNSVTSIIAMLDLTEGRGAKTYYIMKDNIIGEITSPVITEHGIINMADPKVLAGFIIDTVKRYPAEHYMLDIGDHGGGWKGAISDDSHRGWMTAFQLKEALTMAQKETGVKLDIIGFDCCQMGSAEVAYELRENAAYMIGSEANEGSTGWHYNDVLLDEEGNELAFKREKYKNILMSSRMLCEVQRFLKDKVDLTPGELAVKLVDAAELAQEELNAMSATDLSGMDNLAKALSKLGKKILDTDTPCGTLSTIIWDTQNFRGERDLYHFAELINKDERITDRKLKKAAEELMKVINDIIINEEHSPDFPNAHGLTAQIPTWDFPPGYDNLAFDKEIPEWRRAINKIHKKN